MDDGAGLHGSKQVTLVGTNLIETITMDTPLTNAVYKATPTFHWKFVFNTTQGISSNEIDQTKHTVYVTYGDPISGGGSLTPRRLDVVVGRAAGQTNIIGVADALYNLQGAHFDADTDVLPKNFGVANKPNVSDRWLMYSPIESGWDVRGSCIARATLNNMELEMLGIGAGTPVYLMPIPNSSYCSSIEQTTPNNSVTTNLLLSCDYPNSYTAILNYCDGIANAYEGTLKVVDGSTTKYYAGLPDGYSVVGGKPIDILAGVATEGEFWSWANSASVPANCKVTICTLTNECAPIPPFPVPDCP